MARNHPHGGSDDPRPAAPSRGAWLWRVDTARFRWLLLGSLAAANGCGDDGSETLEPWKEIERRTTPAVGTGGDGQTPASLLACSGPVQDLGNGWERCSNGIVHRRAAGLTCTSLLPRRGNLRELLGDACPAPYNCCDEDRDCTAAPHGYCTPNPVYSAPDQSPTVCNFGCVSDTECPEGMLCLCGDPVGKCIDARCTTDAECGGLLCTTYESFPGCNLTSTSCQTPGDACTTDASCGPELFCSDNYGDDVSRSCTAWTCAVGRPFLIEGSQRLAPPSERDDWYAGAGGTRADGEALDAEARAAISDGWLAQALMEHASVAAFARFALQLASLGAPPELIDGTASAMRDEIRHARACFELARRCGDRDLGPGPLSIAGALDASSLDEILVATILEGCIGETVAALEAAEARACCVDPSVRAVLAEIERDESEHARLAWSFVAWALRAAPSDVRERARRTFAVELASAASAAAAVAPGPHDALLLRHGLMPASLRALLRGRVLREVVTPCQRALFEALPPSLAPAPAELRSAPPLEA